MPVIYKHVFDNSDDCIKASCSYANKNKEKCEFIINSKEWRDYLFKIVFKPSNTSFVFKQRFLHKNDGLGPLYFLIIENYKSIDEFVNNHSKLVTFL